LPKDPENITDSEMKKLGYYVQRLVDLGIDRDKVNNIEGEDLIGIRGTLTLYSQAGKGKNAGKLFQNIKNVKTGKNTQSTPPTTGVARQTAAKNPFI
jgi:hypothetical protein